MLYHVQPMETIPLLLVRSRNHPLYSSLYLNLLWKCFNLYVFFITGQTLGSTHVSSQKEAKKGLQATPSIKDFSIKRRLPADETVFKIYKGVKTFDFNKTKNVLATGGKLVFQLIPQNTFGNTSITKIFSSTCRYVNYFILFVSRYGSIDSSVESLCTNVSFYNM